MAQWLLTIYNELARNLSGRTADRSAQTAIVILMLTADELGASRELSARSARRNRPQNPVIVRSGCNDVRTGQKRTACQPHLQSVHDERIARRLFIGHGAL